MRKLRILISNWQKKYASIGDDVKLSMSYIGQTIRTVAKRMDEENNPNVLDGAIANALFTRFFGKKDGEKHTPDLSIKVRLVCFNKSYSSFVMFDLTDTSLLLFVSTVIKNVGRFDLH